MVRIGLTGGIGCGKSYVAKLLNKRGVPVYDSDTEAKQLSNTSKNIRDGLISLTGIENLYADGVLNRRLLAEFLFASKENARNVEKIIHPAVKADFARWAENQNALFCVIESAILIESGFTDTVDCVVVVDAPLDLRISRCVERDSTTKEKVLERISAQMSQEEKCRIADFVIFNDNVSDLEKQIDDLFEFLKNKM
ncbi:MAG: dephospho-CoA kinase [Bacteroidaceae bacterium]|nr:dephospho-CoA kinase [Bacteroidaceae bacterium]